MSTYGQVVTELRISKAQRSDPEAVAASPVPSVFVWSLAEVDNGGLLPDNRREVSFRLFVPVDVPESRSLLPVPLNACLALRSSLKGSCRVMRLKVRT